MAATQAEKSYSLLREKIVEGDLAPGERLVNRSLAQEFGVSVIPVREAINRMASEGLVNQIPGSGAFVHSPEDREIRELEIFRECIECSAAAEAARHISDRELEELEEILRDWESLTLEIKKRPDGRTSRSQTKRWIEGEERFHSCILEASRNRYLTRAAKESQVLTRLFGVRTKMLQIDLVEAQRNCAQHRNLIEVLKSRDPEAARIAMSNHISGH